MTTDTSQDPALKLKGDIPPRRYLSRDEAAGWLGVSTDTFSRFDIPYVDLGPRCRRWDIVDIVAFADDNKRCDSARTSEQRRRQTCVSTNAKARPSGGLRGTTGTASDIAEVLELKIGS
tara:strand:+ start:23624 stop:23980 length:357 start_codon:yes stop_codon:yes gene_type:complete